MSDDTWRAEVYWPAVDVVIPIRNEAAHLAAAVSTVVAADEDVLLGEG